MCEDAFCKAKECMQSSSCFELWRGDGEWITFHLLLTSGAMLELRLPQDLISTRR